MNFNRKQTQKNEFFFKKNKINAIILGKNINARHSILRYFSNSSVFVGTKLG